MVVCGVITTHPVRVLGSGFQLNKNADVFGFSSFFLNPDRKSVRKWFLEAHAAPAAVGSIPSIDDGDEKDGEQVYT